MSVSSRTPSPSPSTSSLSSSNIKQNEREDEACEQKKKLKENLLSDAVIRRIMQWTTTTTTNAAPPLALLLVNRRWSQIATEILYAAPPLTSHDSFERLLALLSRCTEATAKSSSTHDYAAMVRQLDVSGSAADNLYMGDLDRMFALCRGLQVSYWMGWIAVKVIVKSTAYSFHLSLHLPRSFVCKTVSTFQTCF